MPTHDESLQCYDEAGNPTESRLRSEVKQDPPRFWYAVARVWLVNDAGQLMCSKRGQNVSSSPGKWQTFFGGHVGAGQTIKEAAQRELAEEAGITRPETDFYLIEKGSRDEKKVFFESYAVRFNGQPSDLHFTDEEIAEAKWMTMDEYTRAKEESPDQWMGKCKPENYDAIMQWLKIKS